MGLILKLTLLLLALSFFIISLADYMHAVNTSIRAAYIMQGVTQLHMRDLEMRLRGQHL